MQEQELPRNSNRFGHQTGYTVNHTIVELLMYLVVLGLYGPCETQALTAS